MRRWPLFVFGLVAYTGALVVTAPATLVDAAVRQASDARARVSGAQGSLWVGSGQLELHHGNRRAIYSAPLIWQIRPLSLLSAALEYAVTIGWANPSSRLRLTASGLQVDALELRLPPAVLALVDERLSRLELTGEPLLRLESLSLARHGITGNATMIWTGAGSTITPVYPLGDYELQWRSNGRSVTVELITRKGPLQMEGNSTWNAGSPPSFKATARVPESIRPQLAAFMRLIAVERASGLFEINLQ